MFWILDICKLFDEYVETLNLKKKKKKNAQL